MKISVNDQLLFELSETKKKVLSYEIHKNDLEDDLKRRLQWVIMHKYDRTFIKFKDEWDPKLAANGVKMVPTDPDEYAELVFSQPNYESRAQRDADPSVHPILRRPLD